MFSRGEMSTMDVRKLSPPPQVRSKSPEKERSWWQIGPSHAEKTDEEEAAELRNMFRRAGDNTDPLPMGTYVRLELAGKKKDTGDQLRADKQEWADLLAARAAEQDLLVRNRKLERGEKDQEAVAARQQHKRAHVLAMKAKSREREELKEQQEQARLAEARARTELARALDGKLDAAEAAQDRAEQCEARQDREAREVALAEFNRADDERKRALADQSRLAHGRTAEGRARDLERKRERARAIGQEKAALAEARQAKADERAAAMREHKETQRAASAGARAAAEKRLSQRKEATRAERENDVIFRTVRADQLKENQSKVSA